ncbi:MAG: Na+/H+ antiporter subunit C [Syntrophobacteraceae bacterium]
MEVELALAVGALYAAGLYLMMRRSIVKLIIGLSLLGHAANLLIFTMGRLVRERPPVIHKWDVRLAGGFADPIPEALILTAIVIGFGIQAFAIVLIRRTYETTGTEDLNRLQSTDRTD